MPRLRHDLWASPIPFGIGATKPHHYLEMLRTVWENRRDLPYAWRILSRGVCDGCALGVSGFRDWTIEGIHLCTTRLSLLKINTAASIDGALLSDVDRLPRRAADLRRLGRLAHPLHRRRGERGFRRVSWDEALDIAAAHIRRTTPERIAFYLTARGLTNETYYVAQKVARSLGTNNIDNAARICHAPSTVALKRTLGVAATTCSYRDVLETDLVIIFGSDVANAQPVFMKYLYQARKRGAIVAIVNPLREPGLENYWVPSSPESAVFGTRMTDEFFPVHTGGDAAFIAAVVKVLLERGLADDDFIAKHTSGLEALCASVRETSLTTLAERAGSSEADIERFAQMYARSKCAVFVWSMGITQHTCGLDNVLSIVNLALLRGNVGRRGAGLMPIRGHSGVQGGAEMGAYATALPGGVPLDATHARALAERYGFPIPESPGLTAPQMLDAAERGALDVLYSCGGNFLETLPQPASIEAALARIPLRIHQDLVLSTQMLVEPREDVLILPARTRYEQPGGGTETTTERRVLFSPEIPGPRPAEARAEWRILLDVGHRARLGAAAPAFADAQAIRDEIAEVIPFYRGIEKLRASGDQFQWGGERLCDGWVFPTEDGRAHLTAVVPSEIQLAPGEFILSTRRGKQFNTMVWSEVDPLTGAARDALFMSAEDADALGIAGGHRLTVTSPQGQVAARVKIARLRPRNLQMFFPEANPLLARGPTDEASGVPDYNVVVTLATSKRRFE
jgi:molybdopterin-dependent oxidoreductase alpha subunit